MLLIAGIGVIGFVLYHLMMIIRAQTIVPLIAGLIGLGALNALIGLGMVAADIGLGSVAVGIGFLSMNLGAILGDYTGERLPNWDLHAIRIGVSVFLVGLVILSHTYSH